MTPEINNNTEKVYSISTPALSTELGSKNAPVQMKNPRKIADTGNYIIYDCNNLSADILWSIAVHPG